MGNSFAGNLKNGVSFKKDIASLLDSVVSDDVYSVDDAPIRAKRPPPPPFQGIRRAHLRRGAFDAIADFISPPPPPPCANLRRLTNSIISNCHLAPQRRRSRLLLRLICEGGWAEGIPPPPPTAPWFS